MLNRGLKLGMLMVGLLGVGGCSDSGNASDPGAGGAGNDDSASKADACPRTKLTCAEIKTDQEERGKDIGFEFKVTLGTWEGVPEALKAAPPGAELCGNFDLLNQGFYVSNLSGPELRAHYEPIFASLGCGNFTCRVQTEGCSEQYACSCSSGKALGALTTSPFDQYYLVSYNE